MTRLIIFLLFIAAAMPGCKKYLDVKSNSGVISPHTLKDLQMLLDDSYIMNFAGSAYAEASADDYFILSEVYHSLDDEFKNTYTWQNFEDFYGNEWARGYQPIYNCNLILDRLEKIDRAENTVQYDYIKSSALFFRAYQFLSLAWTYAKAYDESSASADPGIVLRTSIDPNVKSSRGTVEACYKKILDDIHSALPGLSLHPGMPTRPSLAAGYGLLARTYLSMANYDSALYYSQKTLELSDQLMDFNDPEQVTTWSPFPFAVFNKETIFQAQLLNTQPSINNFYGLIDTVLYGSYSSDDLRAQAYFTPRNGYYSFKGTYSQVFLGYFSGIATDEIYLISAECKARTDDVSGAMVDLNDLLRTRFMTGTFTDLNATDAAEALGFILTERRKELLMRGIRWIDIKRLNVKGANIALKRVIDGQEFILPANDNRFALPLPEDIIRITDMEQNPR